MDVSDLLTKEPSGPNGGGEGGTQTRQSHPYPTRNSHSYQNLPRQDSYMATATPLNYHHTTSMAVGLGSPAHYESKQPPKAINFQLQLSQEPQHRARLPLRIQIQPHDTTDSIITTVKNFYGLYVGQGVSFEDDEGVTMIARYENLRHNSTVRVRITSEEPEQAERHQQESFTTTSPCKPVLDEPFQMMPSQPYSRPSSRAMKQRDGSPQSAFARRTSQYRTQSYAKAKDEYDAANGFSDSDAGSVSVSSSRRAKSDQLVSAEISLDNIVEGGRRKRAKFESSELPLFAPPQQPMSASISSLSPQRRFQNGGPSPAPFNNHYNFGYTPALPSPQSFGPNDHATPKTGNPASLPFQVPAVAHSHRLRGRTSGNGSSTRLSGGSIPGYLPTPDPTVGSAISDEDVALQLMRLGDPSNQSHGRTSNSTVDDALSGKAEVASSASSDYSAAEENLLSYPSNDQKPPSHTNKAKKKQRLSTGAVYNYDSAETSDEEYEDRNDFSFSGELVAAADGTPMQGSQRSKAKLSKSVKPRQNSSTSRGSRKSSVSGKQKGAPHPLSVKMPPSPYSQLGQPENRKTPNGSAPHMAPQALGPDEEDLSTKPRCQRCRKSKKGCDRQRPCQRCKDAGIGIEGCISEDEGNGRKGRYGRHMGVPVKKTPVTSQATSPIQPQQSAFRPEQLSAIDTTAEAGKKRKR